MLIASWNVNGLRSFSNGVSGILRTLPVDILCVQETKLTSEVLSAEMAIVAERNSYFSFSRSAKGYSGVATYCKDECCPIAVEEGLTDLTTITNRATSIGCYAPITADHHNIDNEGRSLISEFVFRMDNLESNLHVALINVYCPRHDADNPNRDRLEYKLRFQRTLRDRVEALLAAGKHVLVVGDLNIARDRCDHYDHRSIVDFDTQPHRLWLRNLLYDAGRNPDGILVDLFRHFHPNQPTAYTCWRSQMNMRARNCGTRIDYFLASRQLVDTGIFVDCLHRNDVYGSDHCPIVVRCRADVRVTPTTVVPRFCTRFMEKFRGSQMKISTFMVERSVEERRTMKRRSEAMGQTAITDYFGKKMLRDDG